MIVGITADIFPENNLQLFLKQINCYFSVGKAYQKINEKLDPEVKSNDCITFSLFFLVVKILRKKYNAYKMIFLFYIYL